MKSYTFTKLAITRENNMRITYTYNARNITSLDDFLAINGKCINNTRDVYFVRGIGEVPNVNEYIANVDKNMNERAKCGQFTYLRLSSLPRISSSDDIAKYSQAYDKWSTSGYLDLVCCKENVELSGVISYATKSVLDKYKLLKAGMSESILKNFTVKLWFWLDFIFANSLYSWNENSIIKVIFDNVIKEQEYLFCYMLTQIGCDVFLLQNRGDIEIANELKGLSIGITLGSIGTTVINEIKVQRERPMPVVDVRHPNRTTVRNNVTKSAAPTSNISRNDSPRSRNDSNYISSKTNDSEKNFEELALMASSVVMIKVHNEKGEAFAGGSGIMIGRKGFILTNSHVIAGGAFFTVRIEDDDNIYQTDEVIKYNNLWDLAVIRIDRELQPIPIFDGRKKLVRGQKVVAIGSPMGFFNSVSDGIISGFRAFEDVDMIQFTAPTSHGSSGGALLNMQGEVIGISTAGIDSAQNINLAVGYESIRMFAKGFFE